MLTNRIGLFAFHFSVILLCLSGFSARAQKSSSITEGVLRNADRMFYDMEKKQVQLDGHVQVVFKNQHLSCDHARIDQAKQEITAEGNIILTGDKAHVEGERIVFNYKTNTGVIYNGFIQSGQVVFEGEVVEKLGENHYLATNARYTACETCPPGWSFSGKKIDAELGGYARIRRPVFRVGGIPILILPGLIVPLKSARQSGFLVPSLDRSGKGGLALAGTYFWAIDRSQDVTLTAKWYQLRGFKMHEDYRYVLSETSHGDLKSAWMEDRVLQKEYQFKKAVDRWFINYDHIYDMPEDYVHRANLRLISDLRYPRDFPEELDGHGYPALENKTSITKSVDNQYMSLEGDMYTNLLHHDPLARNEDAVHRVPEIRYDIKEQSLGNTGIIANLKFDYVNFGRSTYRYDDLEPCQNVVDSNGNILVPCVSKFSPLGAPTVGTSTASGAVQHDGSFDPATDLLRTGQRMDVRPTFGYPFQIFKKFDVMPSVTYRETQYRFDPPCISGRSDCVPAFSETAARRYVETDISTRTEFSAIYGLDDPSPTATRWKHSIEPMVGYSVIPWMRRPDHAFFGDNIGQQSARQYEPLSDSDLGNPHTGVQFDYNDRTYEKRVINYSLRNRLSRKRFENGAAAYSTIALFQLDQSYDFTEAHRPIHAHPWSSIDALLDVRLDWIDTYSTASYNPYAHKTNSSVRVRVKRSTREFIQLTYNQSFLLNAEDYTPDPNNEYRNVGLGFGFVTKYLQAVSQLDYSDITKRIQSGQYAIHILPPGNCWVINFEYRTDFGADNSFHAGMNFNFGGETGAPKFD
jgi:LPS-assembly protein